MIPADIDPIDSCPFCAQPQCRVIDASTIGTIVPTRMFYVKCGWCEARGPLSRDMHRAVGTWNYTSRAVKNDRGVS